MFCVPADTSSSGFGLTGLHTNYCHLLLRKVMPLDQAQNERNTWPSGFNNWLGVSGQCWTQTQSTSAVLKVCFSPAVVCCVGYNAPKSTSIHQSKNCSTWLHGDSESSEMNQCVCLRKTLPVVISGRIVLK